MVGGVGGTGSDCAYVVAISSGWIANVDEWAAGCRRVILAVELQDLFN